MKTIIDRQTFGGAVAAAFLALAAISCAKVTGGGPSSGADDNGGVTSAGPSAAAPAPSTVSNAGTQRTVMPVGTDPDKAPAPQLGTPETPMTLPSPAVLQRVGTAQAKLEGVTAALEGTKVRFVDCSETASCSARLEAQSLTSLRDLLQSVSAQQGGIGFVAREQLDAYTGRTFVADITMGGAETRPVPADENALLTN